MKQTHVFTMFTLVLFGCILLLQDASESAEKSSPDNSPVSLSRAYAGHDHDKQKDIANLMTVHPQLAGTVLDDCRLCHRDGVWQNNYENHCDYCHASRHTEGYHHNSGDCARGIIAIAVHPLPHGTKEPDWQSRSDELLQSGSLMLFGEIKVETP